MTNIEKLKAEIERTQDDTFTSLIPLADSLGFQAKEHPLRLSNGETVMEYAAVLWDGHTSREVFGTEGRAQVHAMICLVSRWS